MDITPDEIKRKIELESELENRLSNYESSEKLIEDWMWVKRISYLKDSTFRKKGEKVLSLSLKIKVRLGISRKKQFSAKTV